MFIVTLLVLLATLLSIDSLKLPCHRREPSHLKANKGELDKKSAETKAMIESIMARAKSDREEHEANMARWTADMDRKAKRTKKMLEEIDNCPTMKKIIEENEEWQHERKLKKMIASFKSYSLDKGYLLEKIEVCFPTGGYYDWDYILCDISEEAPSPIIFFVQTKYETLTVVEYEEFKRDIEYVRNSIMPLFAPDFKSDDPTKPLPDYYLRLIDDLYRYTKGPYTMIGVLCCPYIEESLLPVLEADRFPYITGSKRPYKAAVPIGLLPEPVE